MKRNIGAGMRGGLLAGCLWAWGHIAVAAEPPAQGAQAPAFTLPDGAGKPQALSQWRGKWVVLYFYPKDDTPGCTTEAANFRDQQARLTQLNAQVVGVSLDDGASHREFADKLRLPFPLLSDRDGAVARQYGALTNLGVIRFAKRHSFLIDPDGRVAKRYLSVEASRHAEEVIADLEALQKP